jgi:hypothetical protein
MPTTVEFFGEQYGLVDEVNQFAMMEFAEAAADGLDADMMQGLAAMLRLIKECIIPADLARFLKSARKNKAKSDDLLPILKATFEGAAERPTGQLSDSSDGLPVTAPKSVVNSDDKASAMFPGRPDLQLAVRHSLSA